jgi:hypothetical protein
VTTDELTAKELVEITGKTRPASQAAVLARQGIPFTFLGRAVRVSRQVAQAHALLPQVASKASGVDFSLVR